MGPGQVRYRLSLPGAGGKYVAAPEMWQQATEILTEVLDRSGLVYEAACAVRDRCLRTGLRVRVVDADAGSLAVRVREIRLAPYQFVLQPASVAKSEVAVRLRNGRRLPAQPVDAVAAQVRALVDERSIALWAE